MHQENETKQSNSIGQRKILLAGGSLLREKKLIKGQPNELDTTSLTRNTNPLRNLQHPRNGENMDVMGSKGREESSKGPRMVVGHAEFVIKDAMKNNQSVVTASD